MRCGNCKLSHSRADEVRACYAGLKIPAGAETFPCNWLVYTGEFSEFGERLTVECGAVSWSNDREWRCANGHSDVRAEIRATEGWDYAFDQREAQQLAAAGVEPRGLTHGEPWGW